MLFSWANLQIDAREGVAATERPMEVVFPVPVALLMALSDRYLAANVASLRAIVAGVENMPPEMFRALAETQAGAAWLNPAHEDNYYVAAAILPWVGQVDSAQAILGRATAARTSDVLPPFYFAFNQLNFRGDVDGAVRALRVAARYAEDPGARGYFIDMADRWEKHQDDASYAITVLQKMINSSANTELKGFLRRQLARIEGLVVLKRASLLYEQANGKPAESLDVLIASGVLATIPVDPTGVGYAINSGAVYLQSPVSERAVR